MSRRDDPEAVAAYFAPHDFDRLPTAESQLLVARVQIHQLEAALERVREQRNHALVDLRAFGVDISLMLGITPEDVAEVDRYQRDMDAYT